MKELKPNHLSELITLSATCQENLERSVECTDFHSVDGEVLRQGKLGYLARNSCLELIYCEDGSRKASYNFEKEHGPCTIFSVIHRGSNWDRCSQMIIGLQSRHVSSSEGFVCVLDTERGKVIKSISIPGRISSMVEIENGDNIGIRSGLVSDLLEHYHGILAVGTVGGHLYLVDLQDDVECQDQSKPSDIFIVRTRDDLADYKGGKRETKEKHCCIYLTDAVCSSRAFQYVDPDSRPLRVFRSDEVSVSSLLHLNQCGLLVCGFSFGCYQLWDMNSLELVYSSPPDFGLAGVSHILFQEPENDPRHCCYIWVGRGPLPSEKGSESPTTLSLYQLVFDLEKYVQGIGTVYQVLDGVCLRFEHQLTSDVFHLADSTSIGGRILCCHVLQRDNKSTNMEKMDIDGPPADSTLAYFVWEAPGQDTEANACSCHLGIFDINRWYHMQLPHSVRDAAYGSRDVACPFFAFYSLTDVLDMVSPDGIVDVYINPDEIQMYSSNIIPRPEQYFWPSSLAFGCICLSERSLVKAEMLGIQRQILADIVGKGTNSFSEAHALFNLCWGAGMIPNTFDISRPQDKQLHYEALLSVVLEHNAVLFVQSCISRWTAGDITFPGCSLRLVLNWAWKRIISTKEQLDTLHGSLFDGYSAQLDYQYLKILDQCSLQMHHLVEIMQTLQTCPVPITEEGNSDFKIKLKVAHYIQQYVDALLMLVDYGMLPIGTGITAGFEDNRGKSKRKVVYPVDTLNEYYTTRRNESVGSTGSSLLHIDKISDGLKHHIDDVSIAADLEWNGTYPPPSINVVCRMFLMDLGDQEARNYFYYWALDMDECLGKVDDETLSTKVHHKFKIPNKDRDLIQALWFIDHKLYAEGITNLLELEVPTSVLLDVILILFKEGQSSYALQLLLGSRVDYTDDRSVAVFIDILLQNGLLAEAYRIQTKLSGNDGAGSLFKDFLRKSYEYKLMSKLFQLPLSANEETLLIEFLGTHQERRAADLLMTYYLQRGLHMEVFSLQDKMAKPAMACVETSLHQNTLTQQAIVESYIKVLPRIQQKLMADPSLQSLLLAKHREEVPTLKPLSAVTRVAAKGVPRSRAGILHAALCSIEANSRYAEDKSPFKPFIGLPITPKSSGQERLRPESIIIPKKESTELPPTKGKYERPRNTTPQTDIPVKRRKHLYSGADALQLLKTPPVVKRPQMRPDLAASVFTPASILKTRTSSKLEQTTNFSEVEDSTIVHSSVVRSSTRKALNITDTTRRRIRFAVLSSPESDLSRSHEMTTSSLQPNEVSFADNSASPSISPVKEKDQSSTVVQISEASEETKDDITLSESKVDHTEEDDEQFLSPTEIPIEPTEGENDDLQQQQLDENAARSTFDAIRKTLVEEFDESTLKTAHSDDVNTEDPKALDSGLDLCVEDDEDVDILPLQPESSHSKRATMDRDSDTDAFSQSSPSEEYVSSVTTMHSDEAPKDTSSRAEPDVMFVTVTDSLPVTNSTTDDQELGDNGLGSKESDLSSFESSSAYDVKAYDSTEPSTALPRKNEPVKAEMSPQNILFITEEDVREVHTRTEEIVVIDEPKPDESSLNDGHNDSTVSPSLTEDAAGALMAADDRTTLPGVRDASEHEKETRSSAISLDESDEQPMPPLSLDISVEVPASPASELVVDAQGDSTGMDTNETSMEGNETNLAEDKNTSEIDDGCTENELHDPIPEVLNDEETGTPVQTPTSSTVREQNPPVAQPEPLSSKDKETGNISEEPIKSPGLDEQKADPRSLPTPGPKLSPPAANELIESDTIKRSAYIEPLSFNIGSESTMASVVQEVVLPSSVLHATPTSLPGSVIGDNDNSALKPKTQRSSGVRREISPKKTKTPSPKMEQRLSPRERTVMSPLSPSKQKKHDQFRTSFKVDPDSLISMPMTRSASRRLSGTPKSLSHARSSLPTYKVDSPLSFVTADSATSTPNSAKRKSRRSLDSTPTHRMRLRSHIRSHATPRVLEKE